MLTVLSFWTSLCQQQWPFVVMWSLPRTAIPQAEPIKAPIPKGLTTSDPPALGLKPEELTKLVYSILYVGQDMADVKIRILWWWQRWKTLSSVLCSAWDLATFDFLSRLSSEILYQSYLSALFVVWEKKLFVHRQTGQNDAESGWAPG